MVRMIDILYRKRINKFIRIERHPGFLPLQGPVDPEILANPVFIPPLVGFHSDQVALQTIEPPRAYLSVVFIETLLLIAGFATHFIIMVYPLALLIAFLINPVQRIPLGANSIVLQLLRITA